VFDQEEYAGTFEEYIELIIQFGHLALFGFCWPLCPLFAVLNNVIEVQAKHMAFTNTSFQTLTLTLTITITMHIT
jgi:hypothetical protein